MLYPKERGEIFLSSRGQINCLKASRLSRPGEHPYTVLSRIWSCFEIPHLRWEWHGRGSGGPAACFREAFPSSMTTRLVKTFGGASVDLSDPMPVLSPWVRYISRIDLSHSEVETIFSPH